MQVLQFLTTQIAPVVSLGKTSAVHLNWLAKIIRGIIEGAGSVGIGIILFSLILKAIVLPFDIYQRVSMSKQNAKMKENKDKMEKLQKQYANDKAAYNQKLMEMYKENGISMFSSCLPAILSIVIFFVAINAFNSYSSYADLNNYNSLVDAYHSSFAANSAEIIEQNIQTGDIEGNGYTLSSDGSGKYFIVVDEDAAEKYVVTAVNKEGYEASEDKVAFILRSSKSYYVDTAKYNALNGTSLTSEECVKKVLEAAQEQVCISYETSISSNMKFLWIKNIWQTDASYKHPVLTYTDFSKTLSKLDDSVRTASPYDESSYNIVTGKLGAYKSQANGYFILIALSIATILVQQLISMKTQKEQQQYSSADGSGAANQKMMLVIMTIMFAIFSFMYSSAFSIYMITSNIVSLISTVIINKAVTVSMAKAERKRMQEKYDRRYPRVQKNQKEEKKKRK